MKTHLASLNNYQKGSIELINDHAKNYAFSNLFETANHAAPYEKIAVAKNFQYVIEVLRAEGTSPWFLCEHDEFALVMDGNIEVEFISPTQLPTLSSQGSHRLHEAPRGDFMGKVIAKKGHMVLLPKNKGYRFIAANTGVLLLQTVFGPHTVEKWEKICIN